MKQATSICQQLSKTIWSNKEHPSLQQHYTGPFKTSNITSPEFEQYHRKCSSYRNTSLFPALYAPLWVNYLLRDSWACTGERRRGMMVVAAVVCDVTLTTHWGSQGANLEALCMTLWLHFLYLMAVFSYHHPKVLLVCTVFMFVVLLSHGFTSGPSR